MAQICERDGGGRRADFVAAAGNAALIREIDPAAPDFEGYLFPNTYSLPRRATAEQLVQQMVTAFRAVLTQDIVQRAAARGLTVRQLVTLASLVEKETAKPEERPLVAAVYTNRLRIGMGMKRDPTVIYVLDKVAGRWQSHAGRVAVPLALQHLPLCRACRQGRLLRRVARRLRRRQRRPTSLTCISSAAMTVPTRSRKCSDEHNRAVFEHQVKPARNR